jgi:hypothetical protein
MNFEQALRCAFDDEKWAERMAIGALIGLVPILNLALKGYQVEVARRAARGEARPLPAWDDLGRKLEDGLLLFVARLVYQLPWLVAAGAAALCFIAAFASLPAQVYLEEAAWMLPALFGGMGLLAGGAALILWLAAALIQPAVVLQYVRHGRFGACFDLRAVWAMMAGHTSVYATLIALYLALLVVYLIAIFSLSMIASMIPCLGWLAQIALTGAGAFWLGAGVGNLQGQALRLMFIAPQAEPAGVAP